MTTTFETAKVGDRVWCMMRGWGEVREVREGGYERVGGSTNSYPIDVSFPSGECETYTLGGLYNDDDITQTLFWDKVVIEAPAKPMPDLEVDTKVLVWSDPEQKYRRHFSHFSNGRIYTFGRGRTSFTTLDSAPVTEWPNWELAE